MRCIVTFSIFAVILLLVLGVNLMGAPKPKPGCDGDGDGFLSSARGCKGNDCNDEAPTVNPGASEDCFDGVDNDCNGLVDSLDPSCSGEPSCNYDNVCDGDEMCPDCPDCCLAEDFQSIDAIGDSISTGFNASENLFGSCTNDDQPSYNWSTNITSDICNPTVEQDPVYSHAEKLNCVLGGAEAFIAADPNSAVSGASMLEDFVSQSQTASSFLSGQPGLRYATIFLGHNDICDGELNKVNSSCSLGRDQDKNNYCRTTPEAFEREFRKGLDILIQVPRLYIGVASLVRVSQLCNYEANAQCSGIIFTGSTCDSLWRTASGWLGGLFGFETGICGSLTRDCSDPQRVQDAFETGLVYRSILESVTAEYAGIPEGQKSPRMRIGGQRVGGAIKAAGVGLSFSNAPWMYKFRGDQISCCDCFHPSILGQEQASEMLFYGLDCSLDGNECCDDSAGDALQQGLCEALDFESSYPGFFVPAP